MSADLGYVCQTCGLSDHTWRTTRAAGWWLPQPCVNCRNHFAPTEDEKP